MVFSYLVLALAIIICVVIHRLAINLVHSRGQRHRGKLRAHHQMISALVLITAHVVEAFIFALGMQAIVLSGHGDIQGRLTHDMTEVIYFSLAVYSSLGFGDLYPHGALRIYVGVETIVGLLMIAWSATVLFGNMFFPNRIAEK